MPKAPSKESYSRLACVLPRSSESQDWWVRCAERKVRLEPALQRNWRKALRTSSVGIYLDRDLARTTTARANGDRDWKGRQTKDYQRERERGQGDGEEEEEKSRTTHLSRAHLVSGGLELRLRGPDGARRWLRSGAS